MSKDQLIAASDGAALLAVLRDQVTQAHAALLRAEEGLHVERAQRALVLEQMRLANEQLVLTSLHTDSLRERLAAALDASAMGTFRWEAASDAIDCDANLQRLFDTVELDRPLHLDELLARVHADDRPEVLAQFRAAAAGGSHIDLEFRTVWADASVHWLKSQGRSHANGPWVFGACAEITDQRRAVEERTKLLASREAERRYRLLTDAVPQLVWTALADGRVDYGNERWFDYNGGAQNGPGARFDATLHADDRQRVLDDWQRAGRERSPLESQARLYRRDGSHRWFLIRAIPLIDAAGQIEKWFGTCTDIDDQKRAEGQAADAGRAKDEFLAMLSHELRNPLSAIVTAVHLMKSRGDQGTANERAIIDRQVGHLVKIVDDLLDLTRLTRGQIELKKQPLHLAKVVALAVEIASPHITRRGHELQVAVADTLAVEGDPTRLTQVIANLLNNAAKYTPAGGHITVDASRDGDDVILRVHDDGVGVAEELLPRMFDMFVQGTRAIDRSDGGLGIGLTVAKKLVELHGGSIDVDSQGAGTGSVFTLRFPSIEGASPVEPESRTANLPLPATKVLVVDDNVDSAELFVELLRAEGYAVEVTHDGESAVALAENWKPNLMLVDIGLPRMDGYEVARTLHTRLGELCPRMIAVTGYGQDSDRAKARAAGFDEHLVKPVHPQKLLDVVARHRTAG